MIRIGWRCRLLLGLAVLSPAALSAQDSVSIAAGPQYRAGGLKRMLLGSGYRTAWTQPVRVEVLDLDRLGPGVAPTEEGGGRATASLRLRSTNGREWAFRAVDKVARRALPEDLQGSIVEDVSQDLTSGKHPAAALALPPVLDALGILHATPRLYVMPDDPRLGQFRDRWKGRLGQVEERLGNDQAALLFPGAEELESTADFLEAMEEHPRNQIAADEYLVARLVDLWVGDWDRHADQWRWARFDRDGARIWRPVPRDRDNVFVRYDGLIASIIRVRRPSMVRFGPRMSDTYGMHYHSAETDRQLLSGIHRAQWDSITRWVQARLTDELIDQSMGRLPPEYRALHAAEIRDALRARRDGLTRSSAELYELVAREAELHATDHAEQVRIERRDDGAVRVSVRPAEGGGGLRTVDRLFVPEETREVRLFLYGGDDRVTLDGPDPGRIKLRLVTGGGDDRVEEANPRAGGGTRVYDASGNNRISAGRAHVDTREWVTPVDTPLGGNPRAPRDYGRISSILSPYLRTQANVGPVVGIGPANLVYGFRRLPLARSTQLRAVWAPQVRNGYGAEFQGTFRRVGRSAWTTVMLRGNRFETWRFHGFGNDSPEETASDDFRFRHDFAGAEVLLHDTLGGDWVLAWGPTVSWRGPPGALPLTAGEGREEHFTGGARLRLDWDRRDTLPVTRSGVHWRAEVQGAAWNEGAPYGRLLTEARTYLPLVDGGPVLALRAGAEHAIGDFPFQDAAMLGGGSRLRGYSHGRFLGDAASWGSAELRQPLGQVKLLVRGRLGILALGDAGRVWVDGDSDGDWHTAYGGGFWFETLGKVGGVTIANGESVRAQVFFGMPF